MTKEEAIEFFEDPHVCYETHGYYTEEEEIEANNMAISALKEPTWQEKFEKEYLFESIKEDMAKLQAENERLLKEVEALKGGWIPIEEREPEESMDVYITLELFDRPPFVEKAFFFKTQRKYLAYGIAVDPSQITAWQPWQPLPKPYKKGE